MRWLHLAAGLLVAWILVASEDAARAQPPGLLRSSVSPWMGLFQRNPGPLGNYNSYVRPQLDLQDTFRQQNFAIQRQGTGIQALNRTLSEMERSASVRPTGTNSVFMDYSHYYPLAGSGTAGRARANVSRPSASSSRRSGMPSMPSMPGI
jgi:hypothetical protein